MSEQMQVNIELSPEQAEGTYANLVLLSHSSAEFVLDFTRLLPGISKARVLSRIIMAPQNAKGLMAALKTDIGKFEDAFGEIRMPSQKDQKSFGFNVAPPSTNDTKS